MAWPSRYCHAVQPVFGMAEHSYSLQGCTAAIITALHDLVTIFEMSFRGTDVQPRIKEGSSKTCHDRALLASLYGTEVDIFNYR